MTKLSEYELYALKIHCKSMSLHEVPEEYRDRKMCILGMASANLNNIDITMLDVPEEIKDCNFFENVLKIDYSFERKSKKSIGYDYPLKMYTAILQHIPDEVKTELNETCIEKVKTIATYAIEQCGFNLEYVPEEIIDKEMVLKAIENGYRFEYAEDKYDTCRTCHIPKSIADDEIAFAYLKNGGRLSEAVQGLHFDPSNFDYETYMDLLKNNKFSVQDANAKVNEYHFISDILDYPMCLEILKKNNGNLEYMPERLIDKDLCMKAIEYSGRFFDTSYIPKDILDFEICEKACKKSICNFQYIPDEYKNYEMCSAAVKYLPSYIKYVPDEFKDESLCLPVLQKDFHLIKYIPDELLTSEMYNTVMQDAPKSFFEEENVNTNNYDTAPC